MEQVIVGLIVAAVVIVIRLIRRAQRSGQTEFRWPTPKSWQLPPPATSPQPPAPTMPPRQVPPRQLSQRQVPPRQVPQRQLSQRQLSQRQVPQRQLSQPQSTDRSGDLDERVRELIAANMEIAAVRLLCDSADLGIIEAQAYARSLVSPPPGPRTVRPVRGVDDAEAGLSDWYDEYERSAAIASSTFVSRDDDDWASGWLDTTVEDRADVDELWQTVRTHWPTQPGS